MPAPSPDGSASPAELSKPQRKLLASAGHLLERFAAACDGLRARVQDGRTPLPSPWREAVISSSSPALLGEGWFVIEFALPPDGKPRMRPRLPTPDSAALTVAAWRLEQPSAPDEPLLSIPEGLGSSLWLALLRLRQLRDFWERELRRNGLDQLLALLPDAWLLDPTPLPPGAVIPRLEIGSWGDLPQCLASGHRFEIHGSGAPSIISLPPHAPAVWEDYWKAAQASSPIPAEVLAETDQPDLSTVRAIYAKKESRVDMIGIIGPASDKG